MAPAIGCASGRPSWRRKSQRPMGRLSRSEVLYMEGVGQPLACENCVHWAPKLERCELIGRDVRVTKDMICGLYVNGAPRISAPDHLHRWVKPQDVGLGKGRTNCGNCEYGHHDNCGNPRLEPWKIDHKGGCCNAWEER